MSQERVGQLFSPPISRAAVAQWETDGGTSPEHARLAVLARAYGTTIDYILTGDEAAQIGSDLSPPAHEVGVAFDRLDEGANATFRDLIFREAAAAIAMPYLQEDGSGESFDHYRTRVERALARRKPGPRAKGKD
jgi:transcriptional regulator with XRE-family HTH domain